MRLTCDSRVLLFFRMTTGKSLKRGDSMSGRRSDVDRLERENSLLRRQIEISRQDPGDLPVVGCGDSACDVAQPPGMATNGGCRCDERTVRVAIRYYNRLAAFRAETIRMMKSDAS
jgi:hypothetical protein